MKTVGISIEEWCRLSGQGLQIPVEIKLAGSSMQPLIRMNLDLVTILPLSGNLSAGDIVLFRRADGAFVVHRVYQLKGDTVITLGDNCENPDPPMQREQILGKVVKIQRGNRTIIPGSKRERRYGRIWMRLLPVRKIVLHWIFVIKKNTGRIKT